MIALNIIIVALAQSSVPDAVPTAPSTTRPDIEVVGPAAPQRRVICRNITMSNSRIPTRRVCQTQAQIEEQTDQAQSDAGNALAATNRRSNEAQMNSGPGLWLRERTERPLGEQRPR